MKRTASILLLALAITSIEQVAIAEDTAADADRLFDEGYDAYAAKDWPKAEGLFERAFAVKPTYDTAANLGFAEDKQGKSTEAAQHLTFAREHSPPSDSPEARKKIDDVIARLSKDVGRIKLTVSPKTARVFVDGARATPSEDGVVFVPPGAHEVRAEAEGSDTASTSVTAVAGAIVPVEITLHPTPTSTPKPVPVSKPAWPMVLLGATAGLGALATVGFVVGSVVRGGDADDAAAAGKSAHLTCTASGGGGGACADFVSAADDQALFGNLAIGAGVFTAVAAGGLLAYALVPTSDTKAAAWTIAPMIGSTSGVMLRGDF